MSAATDGLSLQAIQCSANMNPSTTATTQTTRAYACMQELLRHAEQAAECMRCAAHVLGLQEALLLGAMHQRAEALLQQMQMTQQGGMQGRHHSIQDRCGRRLLNLSGHPAFDHSCDDFSMLLWQECVRHTVFDVLLF
jgi:hypothetical protein